MNAANRVIFNTGVLYGRMAITVFISLYSTRLILNALGSADFGIFNVVGGAIAMLTFLNTAMAGATQRFMSFSQGTGDKSHQTRIFNVSVVLHFLIAIIIFIILEIAGYFLFNGILNIPANRVETAKVVYQFMIISTIFTIISVPYDAAINAHENMLLYAILGILESVLKLLIAIIILDATTDKLKLYGLLMASLSVLVLTLRRIYCHRYYHECRINIKKYFSKPLFKEMTGFAGWSFLGSSSTMIANYGQGIVINTFFGTIVNAAQGIVAQLSGQLGAFAGTMLKALNPIIAKSEGAGNRPLMLRASMAGSKIAAFLLFFFYVPMLIETQFILKLWLKNVPEYTVIFCRLLLIRNIIEQLYIPIATSIAAVGKIKHYQIFASVLSFSPLVASFVFFKMGFSPYSLYIIFIFYSLLNSCLVLYFAKINCGLSIIIFLKEVVLRALGSFLIIVIFAIIPSLLLDESITRVGLTITISSLLFMITLWFIGFERSEKLNIIQILTLVKNKAFAYRKVKNENIQAI